MLCFQLLFIDFGHLSYLLSAISHSLSPSVLSFSYLSLSQTLELSLTLFILSFPSCHSLSFVSFSLYPFYLVINYFTLIHPFFTDVIDSINEPSPELSTSIILLLYYMYSLRKLQSVCLAVQADVDMVSIMNCRL